MQNNTIANNGNQYFQENNYYGNEQCVEGTKNCIEQPQKAIKLSTAVLVTVIGVIADIVAILCGIAELNKIGMKDMFLTYKLHVYLWVVGLVFVFIMVMAKMIFRLLLNKTYGAFLLKDNQIYKIKLKKCPKCGASCGGRLKLEISDHGVFAVCHRDKMHRWKLEYDIIMKEIHAL